MEPSTPPGGRRARTRRPRGSRRAGRRVAIALLLGLLAAGVPSPAAAATVGPPASDTCLACHDVDPARLAQSSHKGFACVRCHADVREAPHATPPQAPRCERCHQEPAAELRQSAHQDQAAGAGGPTCVACHGRPHEILPARDPASPIYHLNLPRTCGQCHGGPGPARPSTSHPPAVFDLYMDSIHGRALSRGGLLVAASCDQCHGSHGIKRWTDPAARVNRANVAGVCGQCHAGVKAQYDKGVHGAAVRDGHPVAPVCNDCHTAHSIRRVDTEAWKLDVVNECGTCHGDFLATYRDTFHGQVTALGFTRVARCSDCHGAHEILPASDPRSQVNRANLVATCRTCHPAANANFAKYDPHADPRNRDRNPVYYYAARVMTGLLFGVFGFFGLHTALWGARSLLAKARPWARRSDRDE